MKYFAYGSNMSLKRLKKRVPSASFIGRYTLAHYSLRFHKVGDDGSAKCDALFTKCTEDQVHGALFDIEPSEKQHLDSIEGVGKGYDEKVVTVFDDHGRQVEAYLYVATNIDSNLKPYTWYLQHVVVGAKEINLPTAYIRHIEQTDAILDPNTERCTKELSIY